MKKILLALMVVCLVGAFCVKGYAQEKTTQTAPAAASSEPAKPKVSVSKITGEVTAVDTKLCTFSLKDETGALKTFKTSVKKIGGVKSGEKVSVTYMTTKKGELRALTVKPAVEKKVKKEAKKGAKKNK
jgi:hypothetical protein